MTEQKHTPGPWGWVEKDGNAFLIQINDDEAKEYPGLKCIADDGSAYGEYLRRIDPDSANAKLIAAAPDLLEALTKCLDLKGTLELHGMLEQVEAAIAKATQ